MFGPHVLTIDPRQTAAEIEQAVRDQVAQRLHRRGAVVGLSGGVDSSVVGMLCARALGAERVLGLFMPERASSDDSIELGQQLAQAAGIRTKTVPIAATLEAAGCYQFQTQAIQRVIPEYDESWGMKLVLPSLIDSDRLN